MVFKSKIIRLVEEIKLTSETVDKPRGVLSVKKNAFENAPGLTFPNRTL